jgi:hypothetical protein
MPIYVYAQWQAINRTTSRHGITIGRGHLVVACLEDGDSNDSKREQ